VFARARENARKTACLSNQKQIGLAFVQYSQDYDERMPPYTGVENFGTAGADYIERANYGWAVLLQPYAKSTQLFQCPSEPRKGASTPSKDYSDYIYNGEIGCSVPAACGYNPPKGTLIADFSYVANTISAFEGMSDGGTYYGTAAATLPSNSVVTYYQQDGSSVHPTYVAFYNAAHRHLDGFSAIFVDGHAKWLPPTKFTPVATPNGSNYTMKVK
jgi:hypothetical protein